MPIIPPIELMDLLLFTSRSACTPSVMWEVEVLHGVHVCSQDKGAFAWDMSQGVSYEVVLLHRTLEITTAEQVVAICLELASSSQGHFQLALLVCC